MEYHLRWVWDASRPLRCLFYLATERKYLVVSIHGYIGVGRGPGVFTLVSQGQNIHHYTGHGTDMRPW